MKLRLACLFGVVVSAYAQYAPGGCTGEAVPAFQLNSNVTLSSYSGSNATLTGSSVLSPACTISAATLQEDATASTTHQAFFHVTVAVLAQSYTYTVYAKRGVGTRNIQPTVFDASFAGQLTVIVDLGQCGIAVAAFANPPFSNASATTAKTQNGWCKITLTGTLAVGSSIWLINDMVNGTTNSYNGDGTSTLQLWGASI